MNKPIYEIPLVETTGLRPRVREAANDEPGYLAAHSGAPLASAVQPEPSFPPPATVHELPVYALPVYEEPVYAQPAYELPTHPAPTFEAIAEPARVIEQPTYAAPVIEAPTYAAPTVPVYEMPTVSAPVYEAPTVQAPVYAAPTYAAPVAPAAVALAPVASAPVAPADDESDFDDPILAPDHADKALITALSEVLRSKASDLHLTSNAPPMLRVDGGLRPVEGSEIWDAERVRTALYTLLSDSQKAKFEENLELDFAYTVTANARFRVNFYQQRGRVGAAFRIIPTEIKNLKDLGVPDTVSEFSKLARGLVLVTGPTGSGKSTTLAALIDLVNRTRADHIVTVEDPIEFMHNNHKSLVNQREVGEDTHSFAAALKHVLRQDPDVILVGELRDLETISVALTAAETGHLVFATLHTQDAAQTIDRVIDVFPPHQQGQVRAQLAATLQGVVCQTLVKRASGKGRAVATEVLVTTPAIANLIREGKTYQIASSMQAGRDLGMYTMDQHLAELVDAGTITYAAGLAKSHDVEGFKRLVHREDPGAGSALNTMSSGVDFGDNYSSTPAGRTL